MTDQPPLFDRLSRQWHEVLPVTVVLSSHLILRGPVRLDGEEFRGLVCLVDNGDGESLIDSDHIHWKVRLLQGARRDTLNAALDVADRIRQLRDAASSQRELVEAVDPIILLKDISNLLRVDPIEAALADNAPQLRTAFHAPFTELEMFTLRVPAPRARRISRRATQVLAARSGDWLRMSASGITPRTVEALEREEVVDIYENRVAARLIDDVRRHLRGILSIYAELTPLMQQVVGPYRKRRRLATLWGSQEPDDGLRDALLRRRHRVESLLRLVDELRDSRLYDGVPNRSQVSQPIRMTNLLEQDPNYRGVRRLWLEWWKTRGRRASPEEQRSQQFGEAEAFFDFSWLVLCHALLDLGLGRDPVPSSDGPFAVDTAWGAVRVVQAEPFDDGAWEVTFGSRSSSVLVVAVACEIFKMPTADLKEALAILERSSRSRPGQDTIVLVPGSSHDVGVVDDSVLSSPMFNPLMAVEGSERGRLWLVPVSPLDLESTERVERVIRWLVLSDALLSYPPRLQMTGAARDAIGSRPFLEWLADKPVAQMLRTPSEREIAVLHQDVEQEHRRLQQQLRGAGQLGREGLADAEEQILKAREHLNELSTCPVCMAPCDIVDRSSNTFEIRCLVCLTRWGLRHDPSSSDRVPYLWLGEDLGGIPNGAEVSRWLGRDVLAEPCQSSSATYGTDVINPWTGRCTAGAQAIGGCSRCAG